MENMTPALASYPLSNITFCPDMMLFSAHGCADKWLVDHRYSPLITRGVSPFAGSH
jgi:hypothetical protein